MKDLTVVAVYDDGQRFAEHVRTTTPERAEEIVMGTYDGLTVAGVFEGTLTAVDQVAPYRIDHYIAIEGGGEIEESHVFCTPAESREIQEYLEKHLLNEDSSAETVTVEPGGEYDYTTEDGSTALDIAKSICQTSGFHFDEDDSE